MKDLTLSMKQLNFFKMHSLCQHFSGELDCPRPVKFTSLTLVLTALLATRARMAPHLLTE